MLTMSPDRFAAADGHVEELTALRQRWRDRTWNLTFGRPDNAFIFVFEGVFCMRLTNGEVIRAGRDELLYIPKGTRYLADFRSETTTYDIIVHCQLRTRDGADVRFSEETMRLGNCPRFRTYFERIADAEQFLFLPPRGGLPQEWETGEMRGGFRMAAAFYDFLDELTRFLLRRDENWRVIENGIAMLEDPSCTASVAEIAAVCGVSERTFRRLFGRCFGVAPAEYREANRVTRARRMLRGDNRSVGEIAAALGFRDTSYFCRRFRAAVGCSPTEYRKGAVE